MPPESSSLSPQTPIRSTPNPPHSLPADALIFFSGAAAALLLFYAFSSFILPPTPPLLSSIQIQKSSSSFYDDPSLSFSLPPSPPISDWNTKRRLWLRLHPFPPNRILMLTASQPSPCPNPVGDHLLLRFFKNKIDYSRLHNIDVFYNSALLHPSMPNFWAKLPLLRAAMVAHPEAEWLWWIDSDAAITDMGFELPLPRYEPYNLVVHGWPNLVYDNRSWTALNAGVFLLRNCQWSMDFLARWARLGPQNRDYKHWGEVLRAELPDKLFPDSDDQSALVYLLLKEKDSGSSDGQLLSGIEFLWPALMVVSSAFQAGASILKEFVFIDGAKRLQGKSLDIFVVNSFGSGFQALFVFLLLPFLSNLKGIPFTELQQYLKDGATCFLNIGGSMADCEGAPFLPLLFILTNMAFNISLLNLVKMSTALLSSLAATLAVPISIYILSLPLPYIPEGTNLNAFFIVGTVILVLGLTLYNLPKPGDQPHRND